MSSVSFTPEGLLGDSKSITRAELHEKFKNGGVQEGFYNDTVYLERCRNTCVANLFYAILMAAVLTPSMIRLTDSFTLMDTISKVGLAVGYGVPAAIFAASLVGFAVSEVKRQLHMSQALNLAETKVELDRVVRNIEADMKAIAKIMTSQGQQYAKYSQLKSKFPQVEAQPTGNTENGKETEKEKNVDNN